MIDLNKQSVNESSQRQSVQVILQRVLNQLENSTKPTSCEDTRVHDDTLPRRGDDLIN